MSKLNVAAMPMARIILLPECFAWRLPCALTTAHTRQGVFHDRQPDGHLATQGLVFPPH